MKGPVVILGASSGAVHAVIPTLLRVSITTQNKSIIEKAKETI